MDVIKNKNAGKVKIETEKEKAKKLKRQMLDEKESEIDAILASDLSVPDKSAKINALEKEIANIK